MAKKVQRPRRSIAANRGKRRVDVLTDEIAPWWKKSFVYVRKTEVATWKGALVIMFITGVAVALVWSAKSGFFESSGAAAASSLSFVPATPSVANGSNFTLTPTITTGGNHVSIVALRITFDRTRIALDSITPSSTFASIESAAVINNTNGTASIDLSVGNANPSVTGTYSVATLNFHAIATGSASAAFTGAAGTSGAAADGETGNVVISTTPATVTVTVPDTTPPSGGSITYTNGYIKTTSVTLTAADGTDSGTGLNTSSRIVQRRSATLSGGTCGSYGTWGNITQGGTYPNFTDTTVASGNCYQYQYLISDNATNQATYTSTNAVRVDTAAPTGGSMTYTNTYITNTTVNLTAADGTDAAAGLNTSSRIVQRRSATLSGGTCGSYGTWGNITQGGTYPNFTDTTVASGNCYQYQYLISDNATNQATYTSTNAVRVDTAAPTGGSMTYTNTYITNTTVNLTAADGTDAAAGLNTSSRIVQRRSATLSGGTCGSYGTWGNITQGGTYPNFTDTTVASGNCYQYQYLISDNATNQATYTSTNAVRVDTAAPTGGSMTYTNTYITNTTVNLTAADGTDAAAGLNTSSRIVQRRSATLSGGTCGSYGTWGNITQGGTYPNFTDTTVASGNCYQYQYRISDSAGSQATYTNANVVKATYSSDLTLDGVVNYLDYGSLHENYGNTTCGNVADVTGPDSETGLCVVNYLDYGILHSEYGSNLL